MTSLQGLFFLREERAVPSPKGLCHQNKYTRYMYNDDPLRQPGPHTRSYTPKRWQKPHTRTHTLESDKGHTHTLLHSKTGGAGWISLRGWAPSGAHAVGSLAASERCLRPTTPSAMCTASV